MRKRKRISRPIWNTLNVFNKMAREEVKLTPHDKQYQAVEVSLVKELRVFIRKHPYDCCHINTKKLLKDIGGRR